MPILTTERDLDRLIKLMKMTASPNDGEALTALRMATIALARVGGDWDTLLRGHVTIIADPWGGATPPPPRRPDWQPKQWAAPRPSAAPTPKPAPTPPPIWPMKPIPVPPVPKPGRRTPYRAPAGMAPAGVNDL